MNDTWIKPRHRFFRNLAYIPIFLFIRLKYGFVPRPLDRSKRGQYLILYNHQTPMDQFFTGISFPDPIYHIATEDIFSTGFIASMLRYTVAPVPIRKGILDIRAIKDVLRVSREGGSIAVAPEGNRTFSGRTGHINPSIAKLAKKLGLPIALYRIEGGYGVEPRWTDKIRRGPMSAGFVRFIEPEEYASMTDAELAEEIRRGLSVDEARPSGEYRSGRSAEYIGRMLYVCPYCGLSEFSGRGDTFSCAGCGREVRYLPDKRLEGVGFDLPFCYAADWYEYQESFVNGLNEELFTGEPLFTDRGRLYRVIVYKKKEPVSKDAVFRLFGDRLIIDTGGSEIELPFGEVNGAAVLGRNRVNFYHGDDVWQLRGSEPGFNALKYVNIYYRYKNIKENDPDGQFLGL